MPLIGAIEGLDSTRYVGMAALAQQTLWNKADWMMYPLPNIT